jgi:hypothetical protein
MKSVHTPLASPLWLLLVVAACSTGGLCDERICPRYSDEAGIVEAGMSQTEEAEGGAATTALMTTELSSGTSDSTQRETETSDSSSDATASETTLESSTGDDGACLPLSEEGCNSETPWCLGEGETNGDGGFAVEPRCVECEEDSHCQWPYVSQEENGICLDFACTPCELGSNRGCGEDAPYCVAAGARAEAGDASVGQVTLADVDGGVAETVECVACLSETDCSGGTPACVSGACVECESDAQCATAEASRCDTETHECVGCNAMGGCAHVEGTPACDVNAGRCVECTREEQSACEGTNPTITLDDSVCVTIREDARYQTCFAQPPGTATQCAECVTDAQCIEGYECVPETFGPSNSDGGAEAPTGKHYCVKQIAPPGTCNLNRPFIGSFEARSEGGVVGTYCRPAYATCESYLDWKTGPDTIPDGSGGELPTCLSSDSCGLAGIDDGYCVVFTQPPEAPTNLCTLECASSLDCPRDTTCNKTVNVPPDVASRDHGVCSL